MGVRILRASDHLPDRFNAASWFVGRHVAEGRGDRVAIVTDAGAVSYGELDLGVRRFGSALRQAGMRDGGRVGIVLNDGPLFALTFWGAIAAGGVPVPLNTRLKPGSTASILADCAPSVLVFDPEIAGPVVVDLPRCQSWPAQVALERASIAEPLAEYAPTERDGPAFMLYSSGTTGDPKGVLHLQHDMWVSARAYGHGVLGIRPDDRCFSVAKLFFAYGLGNAQYLPFDVGAACVLSPARPAPEAIFEQVRRHRPTLFFGVPTAYAHMLAAIEGGADADFSSVRLCASAGEALPASLYERWRERTGLEILDGIGSTEICHCFLSNRPGEARPGSSGVPVPGYAMRLVDEAGEDVAPGAVGDLHVRGDSTMACYWNKDAATRRALSGDWIRTGDKYRCDEDGYFWHAGRSDDMLKVGGIWVSPVEVEASLLEHAAVLECAIIGQEDSDGLTKPHAFVVLRPGIDPAGLDDELKAFAKGKLEVYKYPRWMTFLPELPRTDTGKLQRFRLRALLDSRSGP